MATSAAPKPPEADVKIEITLSQEEYEKLDRIRKTLGLVDLGDALRHIMIWQRVQEL